MRSVDGVTSTSPHRCPAPVLGAASVAGPREGRFELVRGAKCLSPRTRCLLLDADGALGATEARALARRGVCAEYVTTPSDARQRLVSQAWDVVIVNLDPSNGDGVTVVQHATRLTPCPAVLVTFPRVSGLALQILYELDVPFVPKALLDRGLVEWIGAMVAAPRGSNVASRRPEGLSTRKLSERELVVFEQLTTGRAPKEIADDLGVSHTTVRTHAARAYRKLGATNLREAVAMLRNR